MFMPKPFGAAVVIALSLSSASVAFARRPPALVEAQHSASVAFASCPQSALADTRGYRDMLARARPPAAETRALARVVTPQKMGNHLVLVCDGAEIHQGSGYRDFPARLRTDDGTPRIAGAGRPAGTH